MGGERTHRWTRGGWEAHMQMSGRGADGKRMSRRGAKGRARWTDEWTEADSGQTGEEE